MRIIEKAETVTLLLSNDEDFSKDEVISRIAPPYLQDSGGDWELIDYVDDSILGYVLVTINRLSAPGRV